MPEWCGEVTVRGLLTSNARDDTQGPCISFEAGDTWTHGQALRYAAGAACALAELGVARDDVVALFLPNGPDFVRAWWGAACLGARVAPINTAARGQTLRHILDVAAPTVVLADPSCRDRFELICYPGQVVGLDGLRGEASHLPGLDHPVEPWDVHAIMFTSGTTGPAKAALLTGNQVFVNGAWSTVGYGLGRDDTFLVDLPLFHQAAMGRVLGSLATKTKVALRSRPNLAEYWGVIRETGATAAIGLSSMITFLESQPHEPADRDHTLRHMTCAPLPADPTAFAKRFGVRINTAYGSTEMAVPLCFGIDDQVVPGSAGRVRHGVEARVVDEHDIELPDGEVGELILRMDRPWEIFAGYLGDAAATAATWRNGWFHTGDLFHRSSDGCFFFHDRGKDALRRRAQNVSSYEVERDVSAYPAVEEVACVAAPSPEGVEDEIKVWIVPKAGTDLDLARLVEFLVERMPHYMVPRYFEVTDELPKTASMKLAKYMLRQRGNTDATWDRVAHGLHVSRDGLRR